MQITQQIFRDIKFTALTLWNTREDKYGYASQKINQVMKINDPEEWYVIWQMFDGNNQQELLHRVLLDDTRKFLRPDLEW